MPSSGEILNCEFELPVPPRDGCIGYGRGDARQINRVLIPGPLFFHRLLLKGWREFDLFLQKVISQRQKGY